MQLSVQNHVDYLIDCRTLTLQFVACLEAGQKKTRQKLKEISLTLIGESYSRKYGVEIHAELLARKVMAITQFSRASPDFMIRIAAQDCAVSTEQEKLIGK